MKKQNRITKAGSLQKRTLLKTFHTVHTKMEISNSSKMGHLLIPTIQQPTR